VRRCNRTREGSRVATARENARRRAEKGVSGRASKEGRRSVGPSEGAGLRKATMRTERCAAGFRTSLGCCMRCAQSAAGESPLNPKVQHVHYDTGPRVRATAGHAAAAGCWPETPGVSDFAKYRAPRTPRERHARAHDRASKTVQPTFLPPRSGICARGKETCTHGIPVAVRRPSRAQ